MLLTQQQQQQVKGSVVMRRREVSSDTAENELRSQADLSPFSSGMRFTSFNRDKSQ